MGLSSFIDELFDTTEELIRDTPKTVKEKLPEMAAFVGKNAIELGQKAVTHVGKKIAQFQSEEFMQKIHDSSIDIDVRRDMLSRHTERKINAVNASITALNAKLENPDISDAERQKTEQEIRDFERRLRYIENEHERLSAEIERSDIRGQTS